MKMLKKLTGLLLASVLLMPVVHAEGSITTYGEVKDITGEVGDRIQDSEYTEGTVEYLDPDTKQYVSVTIDSAQLKIMPTTTERTKEAAWVGITVTAPENADENPYWIGGLHGSEKVEFKKDSDGKYNGQYTIWAPITASELAAAVMEEGPEAYVSKSFTIYWGGQEDEEHAQTILINVKVAGVKLEAGEDSKEPAWTEEDYDSTVAEYNAIQEANKPTPTPTAKPAETNPDTSDNASLLFGLLALGVCGLGLTAKKRLS